MTDTETTSEEVLDTTPQIDETASAPVDNTKEVEKPEPEGPLDLDAAETKAETEAPDDGQEKPKKSRFQERIDRLTADKYQAEREARHLRDQLEKLKSRQDPEYDPQDYEAAENARLRRVMREEQSSAIEIEAEQAARNAAERRAAIFQARLEEAKETIPDLEQSMERFAQLPVTQESAELIAESDKAAHIAHYLSRNPTLAYEIANMSPAMQGRAIAQIEHRVSLPTKKASKAPPPPPSVKPTSNSPLSKSADQMSALEYLEWRQSQWKK